MTNYREAIGFLYDMRMFGMKLGLQNIRFMLEESGHPEASCLSIHIAGTNGKGSVAAMVESVLRGAGLRTGLFTSPHISTFRERIRINGELIQRDEVESQVAEMRALAERMGKIDELTYPTFFEIVTAMAARYFRDKGVEVAVIETGLGGRLDATNAFPAKVNVITGIGLEHQQYLGNTIGEIAGEKAGIIKEGASVISAPQVSEAMEVIQETMRERGANLLRVGEDIRWSNRLLKGNHQLQDVETPVRCYQGLECPLIGLHQAENICCAIGALESLPGLGFDIGETQIREGIRRTSWPARFEIAGEDPVFVLDTAANPHAGRALAATMSEWRKPGQEVLLLLGMLNDKDHVGFSRAIAEVADEVLVTEPESERSLPADKLAAVVRSVGCPGKVEVATPLSRALDEASRRMKGGRGIVLVTGSLFLMARARHRLGLADMEEDFSATDRLSGGNKETV